MQISANTMTGSNPGFNLGNFLQMFQMLSAGQSSGGTASLMNLLSNGSDADPFGQILIQQLTTLLQSGNLALNASQSTTSDLSSKLQKALESNSNISGDAMSELALFAMGGQQIMESLKNQPIALTQDASQNTEDTSAKGLTGAGNIVSGGQLTSLIVQAIQEGLNAASSKSDNQTVTKDGAAQQGNTEDLSRAIKESALQNETAQAKTNKVIPDILKESSSKDKMAAAESVAAFVSEVKNSLDNVGKDKKITDNQNEQTLLSKTENVTDGISARPANLESLVNEADKSTTTAQTDVKVKSEQIEKLGEKTGTENVSVESQLNKAGANIKSVLTEQGTKSSVAETKSTEKQNQATEKITDTGVDEVNKKTSPETDLTHNDRHNEMAVREFRNNLAAKEINQSAAFATEATDVSDKTKTELKGKSSNLEKNLENNISNTAAVSTGVQAKQDSGDVSASSVINRVAAEFRENLMTEGGRVKITLTPPSLGSLEMDVSVQNNRVKVMLIAENKDVQKMLSGNLETLKTTLQTQGLTIERCDVMMQDSRDEYPQGFSGQQAFGHEQTGREKNSRQETFEDKPYTQPTAVNVQRPVSRPLYSGSESISLFA